jgi:SAM-dependent methyltransferase
VTLSAFDHALGENPALLLRSDGGAVRLDVARWNDSASPEDAWLLDRCSGAVVDLGCGPGRLLSALADRGVPALGIDVSPEAETRCRRRGVPMLRADLFAPLPGEGRWDHVLLADGNIGIGGDPARLLRRADQLLRRGGSVLVETDPDADAYWRGSVRVATAGGLGAPIPWAAIGTRALQAVGRGIGLRTGSVRNGDRCFVELRAGPRFRRR